MFSDVEYGLNTLWNASFNSNGTVYKENLGYFTPDGLLILPNKHNTTHSSRHALPTAPRDGKQFVLWNGKYVEILGIIHTHPNRSGKQDHSPGVDFQMGFSGIHNYVMSHGSLYDGYLKGGREVIDRLGPRNAYNRLPAEFFGFTYTGW